MSLAIGLDIGARTVRAIALAPPTRAQAREGARARVVAHASLPRDGGGVDKPVPVVVAEVMELLGVRGPVVVQDAGLPVLVRFVPTMPMAPERLERVLRLELAHHAHADGDLAADAVPVAEAGEPVHCCVVAQPPLARGVLAGLADAGVAVEALHAATAAVANAVLPSAPVRGDDVGLLIDIGHESSQVTVFGEDRFIACRQVPVGGAAFAQAVAAAPVRPAAPVPRPVPAVAEPELSLDDGIPFTPAPSARPALALDDDAPAAPGLVLDDGPAPAPAPAIAPEPGAGSGTFTLELDGADPVPPPAGMQTQAFALAALGPEQTRVAEALFTQVSSALLWFRAQVKRDRLQPAVVLLAGGGAGIPGLADYLARRFAVPVRRFDPFASVDGGDAVAGSRPEDPHAWATALGLALASRRLPLPGAVRIDLRPEHDVRRAHARAHHPWVAAAGVLLVVAAGCVGVELWRQGDARERSLTAIEAHQARRKELEGQLTRLDADKEALADDLRAAAGRIYAGRDLLLAIRALKERAGGESPYVWVTRLETAGIGRSDAAQAPRPPAGGPPAFRDTAIDRGSILLSGQVRFEETKTDTALNQYFADYKDRLTAWRPAPGAPTLFRRSETVAHSLEHAEGGPRKGQPAGSFQFTLRLEFQPTELAAITAAEGVP